MSFITAIQKQAKAICTPASELVEEHEHLVRVLHKHRRAQEEKEAKKQSKELKEYKEDVGSGEKKRGA